MKNHFIIIVFFLLLGTKISYSQYCTLSGQTPYSSLQPGITNFMLNTINRTSSNSESPSGVVVTTALSTTLVPGQSYTISMSHSEDTQFFIGARNNLRIWVDFNNNFSYGDAGETIMLTDLQAPGTTYTFVYTLPLSIPSGTYSLRATAKMSIDAGHTLPTPCNVPADPLGYHGEMEDYSIIVQGSGQAPQSTFAMASTACINIATTVTNSSVGLPNPTFSWTASPAAGVTFSPSSTGTNPSVKFNSAGTYTVKCIATNSLSSNTSQKVLTVTNCHVGIEKASSISDLAVYPNPAKDFVHVRLSPSNGQSTVNLKNVMGQVLQNKEIESNNQNDLFLDLNEYDSGIYLLEIQVGEQKQTKKLIIER